MKFEEIKKAVKVSMAKPVEVIREAGEIPADQPIKMFVTGYECDNGFAHIKAAAEIGQDQYVEKEFSFKTEGKGRIFWEKFLNTAFPDQSTELNSHNILGMAFVGKLVINEGHENLEAVGPSEDLSLAGVTADEFMAVCNDELPFV